MVNRGYYSKIINWNRKWTLTAIFTTNVKVRELRARCFIIPMRISNMTNILSGFIIGWEKVGAIFLQWLFWWDCRMNEKQRKIINKLSKERKCIENIGIYNVFHESSCSDLEQRTSWERAFWFCCLHDTMTLAATENVIYVSQRGPRENFRSTGKAVDMTRRYANISDRTDLAEFQMRCICRLRRVILNFNFAT